MSDGPPPISAIRHAVHRLRDPDEFAVAVSGGQLVADFFTRQEHPTLIEQFQTPSWALDFQEAHVKAHIHCPLPPDWASVGLMRSPAISSWYGFEAAKGILMCNPPGEAIDGCIAPGFNCLTINVPAAFWEHCRKLAGSERTEFGKVSALHLPPSVYDDLERRVKTVLPLLRHASTCATSETTALVTEIIVTAWELSSTTPLPLSSHRNRTRLAHRAEDWMRANLSEPFQVPDVCLALGVSRRELEYAFRFTFDHSPRDFLQALRLNAIRRSLMRAKADASLMDVAFDHGIMHLGRFAAQYRSLFGENPSLSRRRKALGD